MITKEYAYDAFGNEKNIESDVANLFGYYGEYYDLSRGTYYLISSLRHKAIYVE